MEKQMDDLNRVLMVASENDGLRGGKVGDIGDVLRDVPPALAKADWEVDVVTPSYGFLHKKRFQVGVDHFCRFWSSIFLLFCWISSILSIAFSVIRLLLVVSICQSLLISDLQSHEIKIIKI